MGSSVRIAPSILSADFARLGEEIKKRERRLKTVHEVNESLKQLLATKRSPAELRRSIKDMNLGMGPPEQSQVWRLVEPPREASKPPVREGPYMVQDGPGPVLP